MLVLAEQILNKHTQICENFVQTRTVVLCFWPLHVARIRSHSPTPSTGQKKIVRTAQKLSSRRPFKWFDSCRKFKNFGKYFSAMLNSTVCHIPSMLVPPVRGLPLLSCLSNLCCLLIALAAFLACLAASFFWFHFKPHTNP